MKTRYATLSLACLCLLGAKQYTIPMATSDRGPVSNSGATTSLIVAQPSGLSIIGGRFNGYLGFGMTFNKAIIPKQLCSYRVAGDANTARSVALMDETSQTVLVQTTIDMTRGAEGQEVCVNVNSSPVNTYDNYDLFQEETADDIWADRLDNAITLTAMATWKYASYCGTFSLPCHPAAVGVNGAAYGIPDLRY